MNFDGKAVVNNTMTRMFASSHGNAIVINNEVIDPSSFTSPKNIDKALVVNTYITNENKLTTTDKIYSCGLVPYTVQVYGQEEYQYFKPQKFVIIRDATIHDKIQDFSYNPKRMYVSRIQPTNIKYNPKSAIVYDTEFKESQTLFTGTSVNVNSKIAVAIPEKTTDYSDMSLVIQKNSFIEIKVPENIVGVINLPDDLEYVPGYIKGTFTQSGEYNIKIMYLDGEQLLNIIVPYYQRLL